MVTTKESDTFYLRKLTKSGASRYLSIGTILKERGEKFEDWRAVKVFVEKLEGGVCILRLEQIK